MTSAPTILREIRSPTADAQIVEWRWPTPLDVTARESRHMLEMSLPPFATDGVALFPERPEMRAAHMGPMFIRPADITLRAKSQGGQIRVVRCAVEPKRYAEVVERDPEWTAPELRAAMHLRGEALKSIFQLLRRELMEPSFGSVALVDAYATALMVETARRLAEEPQRAEGRLAAWQYRRINERLAEQETPPTVAELAALCGVSPRHLLRLYRNIAGETVTAHIQRSQVQRAQTLLSSSDLPLKEIAARLGFAHAGSFSSAFRRVAGVTPRVYRQQRLSAG